jgi:hypothetical protein
MRRQLEEVAAKYDRDLPLIRAYAENVLPKKLEDPAFRDKLAERIERAGFKGHFLDKCIDDPRLMELAKKLVAK